MSTGLRPPSCIQTQDTYTPASSQSPSPNSSSQPETPFTATRVTAADRPLLVRVLNRNLVQQREEANMHSLGSDLLLNSLPAGKLNKVLAAQLMSPSFSADKCWCLLEQHQCTDKTDLPYP